jgi:tRNA(adenine34) deaminase
MDSVADKDRRFMALALAQAERAGRKGEVPVGAVVILNGEVLSRGRNATIAACDPTAHAEVMALREACRRRRNHRLPDCELYVTLEPCALCLGAVVQARVKRLVYGARDPKAGAVGSVMKFPFRKLNHRPEIRSGVLADECGALLKEFFRTRREHRKKERVGERWPSG